MNVYVSNRSIFMKTREIYASERVFVRRKHLYDLSLCVDIFHQYISNTISHIHIHTVKKNIS